MRIIIRGIIAVVVILWAANFFSQSENIALVEGYKNDFVQSEPVQNFLNSQPVQKLENFDLEDVLPSDLF